MVQTAVPGVMRARRGQIAVTTAAATSPAHVRGANALRRVAVAPYALYIAGHSICKQKKYS